MFKDRYMKIAKKITPDNDIREKIISECEIQTVRKSRMKFIPVIAVIIIVIALPVMAYRGYIDRIAEILKEENNTRIAPAISTDIHDGIKMELNGGTYSGNVLTLYGSIEDTMGKRIKKDTLLLNSRPYYNGISIDTPGAGFRGAYDIKNNKKIFRLNFDISESLTEKSQLQLRTDYILSDKKKYKHIEIPVDKVITDETVDLLKDNEEFDDAGLNVTSNQEELEKTQSFGDGYNICIKPSSNDTALNDDIDFLYYNNTGFVNNKLHINMTYTEPISERTRINMYAVNSNKKRIYSAYSQGIKPTDMPQSAAYSDDGYVGMRKYEQFVFDIDKEEFKDCSIYADIEYYSYQSEEPFILYFDCNEFLTEPIVKENIPFGENTIYRLEITPTSVIGTTDGKVTMKSKFIYDDGTECSFTSGSFGSDGEFTLDPETYIDIDRLYKIIINGITVYEK